MRKDQQDSPIIDWPSRFSCIALCSSLDMVPVWRYAHDKLLETLGSFMNDLGVVNIISSFIKGYSG